MAMYSTGVITVINDFQGPRMRQVWFTDNVTACGSLHGLHKW